MDGEGSQEEAFDGGPAAASSSSTSSSLSSFKVAAPSCSFKSFAELDAAQALLGVSPNTVVVVAAPPTKRGPLHGFTTTTTTTGTAAVDDPAIVSASAPAAGYASSSIPSWARGNAITQSQPLRFVTAAEGLPKFSTGSQDKISNSSTADGRGGLHRSLVGATLLSHESPVEEVTTTLDNAAVRRGRSGSVGLDALAEAVVVATTEDNGITDGHYNDELPEPRYRDGTSSSSTTTTSNLVSSGHATSASGSSAATTASEEDESSDDSEMMPPPPPRTRLHQQPLLPSQLQPLRRPRSLSNPEGMGSVLLAAPSNANSNHHFRLVLPDSVLEEELARVSAAMMKRRRRNYWGVEYRTSPTQTQPPGTIPEEGDEGTYEDDENGEADGDDEREMDEEEEDDVVDVKTSSRNKKLDSEELLRRARARLFEDLMLEGKMGSSGAVEKGIMALPHSFDKYKAIYNKDGRIGIYTPTERAAIIERFMHKRSRRVWNKKIRYDCRKNLADRRLRVKGRFVKRSEQEQLESRQEHGDNDTNDAADTEEAIIGLVEPDAAESMPDVNDPEAGFAPTDDLPYRRLRRHTVT